MDEPMPTPKPLKTSRKTKSVIKNLLIDLDGVMYIDDKPTLGARGFVDFLQKNGYNFLFLTNNSTKTRMQFARKLKRMGIDISVRDIMTSSYATCLYLKGMRKKAKIYAIGEHGLFSELERSGFMLTDERPDFVVVGLDRKFDYGKLACACNLIRGGAGFVATNTDPTLPVKGGHMPGAGAIVTAIEACSMRKAFVVGKPNPKIAEMALGLMGARKKETAIVGDRIKTDVLCARRSGMKSILLLSGVESKDTIKKSQAKPDRVFLNLADLMGALRHTPFL